MSHSLCHRYPNKQQQELFFSHYMAEDAAMKAGGSGGSAEAAPLPASVMDQLSASANVWALASHLYWGIWAIIQVSCHSYCYCYCYGDCYCQ